MYMVQIGPVIYDRTQKGGPISLVEALREIRGVGDCKVLRTDGTVVVKRAGSDTMLTHEPTGRRVSRRKRSEVARMGGL